MARPKSSTPRDRQLNLSLRTDEYDAVCARAAAFGKRPVEYARQTLLGERADRSEAPVARYDRLVLEQLKRVGSNLNQIARQMNALGRTSLTDLELALGELRDLVRRMG